MPSPEIPKDTNQEMSLISDGGISDVWVTNLVTVGFFVSLFGSENTPLTTQVAKLGCTFLMEPAGFSWQTFL